MSAFELKLLGEFAVYPGHPLTIAYCIVNKYPSLEEAVARKKSEYQAALADGDIPGAGGCVYSALDFLRHLSEGLDPERCVRGTELRWESERDNGYAKVYEEGKAQAERIKPLLFKMKHWWARR